MITSGEPFIDKFSWGDLLYEMRVDSYRRTYVYERKGQIQGFVSFRVELGESVLVDTLAVDEKRHKQGLGGHLIRWSETCGRNADCSTVRLWAVDSRKDWYERQGYERRGEKMVLDGVGFHLMDKRLLYNLPDDHVLTMGH
jgi:N-acetylglutamate synthase-like GNAT family acetyltransferase